MRPGQKLIRYDAVSSTNLVLKELAQEGVVEAGTAVVASTQEKGRGRFDRRWESPEGGLWLSVLLDAGGDLGDNKFGLIPLMAGCAVASAIADVTGLEARVKWPNDVLIGGRKVCGILGELLVVDGERMAIVGIGINVNNHVREGYDFSPYSTSIIEETGKKADLETLEKALFREMDARLSKKANEILDEWRGLSDTLGRRVSVTAPERVIEGLAKGIDENGALVLQLDNGTLEVVVAGDCRHV